MSWVLHVDLDQFLAAVEQLRRPELRGRPVVVGGRGDPTERGVVATASYEARASGVRSGMPLRVAARRCPEAVFLPVDRPAYEEASAAVQAVLRAQRWGGAPVLVEVLGWDEAFFGPDPARPADDPGPVTQDDVVAHAHALRAAVLAATGLHCSVGVGDTTVRAKNATDRGKPRGVFVLTAATWLDVLGEEPVRGLWGIGPRTSERLRELGIATVAELAATDPERLVAAFGPSRGRWYAALGRGEGATVVDPTPWVARAHGREETFQTDLEDPAEVRARLRDLAARVLADLDAEDRPAVRVHLKVRFRPFTTLQRSRVLPAPTRDLDEVTAVATDLLDTLAQDRPVRLLGIRLEMVPPPGGYDR